jgi:fumarate reductase subunit D
VEVLWGLSGGGSWLNPLAQAVLLLLLLLLLPLLQRLLPVWR